MSYAKYESYKDSGVDWLGKIPSDWDLQPAFKYIKENKTKNTGLLENTVLSLSYGKIIIKPEEKLTGLVPESFETYQIVEPNDIIIRCTDLQNDKVSLRTGLVENRGIITSAYLGLKVFQNYNSKFLHYYLHSLDITKAIYKFGTGLRQNLSFLDFKRLPLVDISLDLQQKIANFLDQKTAQIDQAIALKQQQIEKLGEYKQIVIQNAVTKGLNPNAKMKNSGVEWIGDIPEHWEVKKLKFLGKCIIGLTYSPNDISDKENGTLVLRSSNLKNGHFYYSEDANVYVQTKIPNKLILKKDDILICSRNGSRDLIGKCAIATEKDIGNSFGAFTTVFRSELNPYLYFIFNSGIFKMLAGSFLTSTINQLTTGNLNTMQMPIPPNKERQEIISYLTDFNEKIANAIKSYQTQIHRLKEYKNILINQAVTGKIKI
ncbi:restriction endonuclease subunit S [Moraxella sp. 179-F 1C4 NHS]